jgi:NADH:ubiquinone reductase (H+-translocating)
VPACRAAARTAVAHDVAGRRVQVETAAGGIEWVEYERLVVALGSISRTFPIPGLADYGLGFKTLADAIHLRNHVLRRLEAAVAAPSAGDRQRELTFVFVGAGHAGVKALGELSDLVRDALRYYDDLRDAPQRWVLVDLAPRILLLSRRGVEIRTGTTLERLDPHAAFLSDGECILTSTLVWTAGVRPKPALAMLGLPLDEARPDPRRRDTARRGSRARPRTGGVRARAERGHARARAPIPPPPSTHSGRRGAS